MRIPPGPFPFLLTLGFGVLVACGSGKGTVDGAGTDTADGTDAADDGSGQGGSRDGEAPWIESGTVTCEDFGDSTGGPLYLVEIEADDPQRRDELVDFGGAFTIYDSGGNVVHDMVLACEDGDCSTSVREAVCGVPCSRADEYTFTAQVEDIDGNFSDEFELEWED